VRGVYRVLILCGVPLWAQQAAMQLTLKEAEQLALKNNPQLSSSRFLEQAAAQTPLELRAAYYPTFFGSVTGVGADSGSRIAAGALNNPALYSRFGTGLTLSQMVYDFGRTGDLVESARLRAQAQAQSTTATKDDLILLVRRSYFTVLRAGALVKVAEQTVSTRQVLLDQVRTMAKNRLKSELDVRFASVNLADAKLLLSTQQNQMQAAKADLVSAMGIPTPRSLELEEAPLPADMSSDLGQYVRQAMQARPELRLLRLQHNAAQRFAKAEKKLMYPTFGMLATAGVAPAADQQVANRYGGVGLNMNIPIFNGWQFRARRNEAEFQALAAEQRTRDLANRIERDVRVAWLGVQNAIERRGLTAQLLEQARLALELAQGRYDLGLGSIVELSQAQLNLTTAQIAETNARYDYQLQRSVLDYQAGMIP